MPRPTDQHLCVACPMGSLSRILLHPASARAGLRVTFWWTGPHPVHDLMIWITPPSTRPNLATTCPFIPQLCVPWPRSHPSIPQYKTFSHPNPILNPRKILSVTGTVGGYGTPCLPADSAWLVMGVTCGTGTWALAPVLSSLSARILARELHARGPSYRLLRTITVANS